MKYISLLVLLSTLIPLSSFGQLPTSNIWLLKLEKSDGQITIHRAVKLTDNQGYSNQPHFTEDSKILYYTQGFDEQGSEQTDVMAYHLSKYFHTRVTESASSQYSPTPTPSGDGFSAIHVDGNQKQWLYQYHMDGQLGDKLTNVEPIGYHVWIGRNHVLAFVLGQPHTLQKLGQDNSAELVDDNIGASLWPIPGTDMFSYTKNPSPDGQPWTLMAVNPETLETNPMVAMPLGAYYMAWSPSGIALTGVESKILGWDSHSPSSQWQEWLDVSAYCKGQVSRIHVDKRGLMLAFVCDS